MPEVTLLLPDGEAGPDGAVSFAVAPQPGEAVLLDLRGKRRFFLVEHVFHGMASDGGEILYFAVLSRAPPKCVDPRADAQF